MELRVQVRQTGTTPRPPAGTPITLEVRDVSLQDVAAVVLATAEVEVAEADDADPTLATATIEVPDEAFAHGRDVVVWARVAASGEPSTAVGDLITMQHRSLGREAEAPDQPVEVAVTRIG